MKKSIYIQRHELPFREEVLARGSVMNDLTPATQSKSDSVADNGGIEGVKQNIGAIIALLLVFAIFTLLAVAASRVPTPEPYSAFAKKVAVAQATVKGGE